MQRNRFWWSNFWLSLAQKFIDSSLKVRWWKRKLIFPSHRFFNRVVQKEIQFLWKKSEEEGNEHDAIRKSMSRNFCQHLVNGRLLKGGQGHSHFFSWKCLKCLKITQKVSFFFTSFRTNAFLCTKRIVVDRWRSTKLGNFFTNVL